MYDAIIVGARCAGSSTALLLARKGYRVLLVDRVAFPSDTISGHCILHRGVVRLKRWGLLNKVLASNTPAITKLSTNFGDFTLSADIPLIEDVPAAVGPRRTVLDSILLEAAQEAGAEVRQNFTVSDLLNDSECITGIRGRTSGGTAVTEQAKIVIGADGKHSRIAQLVQAPVYMEVPSLTCWYMSYWSDFPCEGLEIHWRHHRLALVMPTTDGLVLQAVAWPHAEFHEFRRDIDGNVQRTLALMPEIADRLPHARRASQYFGMADVPGFFRRPFGPGWALVGDAGHHKDPTPAYGISDAFCDAELLAEALDEVFSGRREMQDALAEYEQQRNVRAIPDHELTCQRARLEHWDAPEVLALRNALRGSDADTAQYHAVIVKVAPPQAFFTPDNIKRIMTEAAAHPV